MSSFFSSEKTASMSKSLGRVQEMQSSFFRRLSSEAPSPSAPAATMSTGKLPGGEPEAGSTSGNSFVCIRDPGVICGGLIGAGAKFCIKAKVDCAVVKHDKAPFEDLIPGIYLRGGGLDAYCSPCLPTSRLSQSAAELFIQAEFEDVTTARQKLDQVDASTVAFWNDAEVIELLNAKKPPRFATPAKKPTRNLNLRSKFDNTLQVVDEEEDSNKFKIEGTSVNFKPVRDFLGDLASTVEENQQDLDRLQDQVFESSSQIGIAPRNAPPTLWVAHMEAKGEIQDLQEEVKRKADVDLEKQILNFEGRLDSIQRETKRLRDDAQTSFNEVAFEFEKTRAVQNINGTGISPETQIHLEEMHKRLDALGSITDALSQDDSRNQFSVRIGKYRFQSMEEVGAWADKCLPSSFCFGPFVDAYSFLERVKSARDVSELGNIIGDMDTRRKSSVSADESIVIQAFQHPLPHCFRGSSSSSTNINSWLPGLKTKAAWENENSTRGTKIAIRDNMEGIRSRVEKLIQQRLHNHAEAQALARECLSDTMTFITSLCHFISNTFLTLTTAGYPDDDAWTLVSKLIYRMFATDCYHDKRGIATELLDSDNHRSIAVGILWATFATHEVMREYLRYTFADHPSMSGEYTRFLVAHAGISKLASAEKTISKLMGLVNALEKKVEMVDKKATTATSKADEAVKLVKKKKEAS